MINPTKKLTYSTQALLALQHNKKAEHLPDEIKKDEPTNNCIAATAKLRFWGAGLCKQSQNSFFNDNFDQDNPGMFLISCR